MSTDLSRVEVEMAAVIENLEKSLSRLKASGKESDEKRIERCVQLLKKLGGLIESFKLDVVSLDEGTSAGDKKAWELKLVQYETRMTELRVDFNEKRREVEKRILLKGSLNEGDRSGAAGVSMLSGEEDVLQLNKKQALEAGDVLLDKAEKSIARTKKMVVESEQVGTHTLAKMDMQNEQMERIYEDFDDIDSSIARAKRLLGHIAQSAVNDRCVQILSLLVFIGVVIAMVQVFHGSSSGSSTSSGTSTVKAALLN